MYNENRFRVLLQANPQTADELLAAAQANVDERWRRLTELSRSVSEESEAT